MRFNSWVLTGVILLLASSANADCPLIEVPPPSVDVYAEYARETVGLPPHGVVASPPGGGRWVNADVDVIELMTRNGAEIELTVVDAGLFGTALRVPDDATTSDLFSVSVAGAIVELPVLDAETTDLTLGSFVVHGGQRTDRTPSGDCCDTFPTCIFVPRENVETVTSSFVAVRASVPPFDLAADVPNFLVDVWLLDQGEGEPVFSLEARAIAAAPLTEALIENEVLLLRISSPGEWHLAAQLHDVRTGERGALVQAAITIAEPTTEPASGCSATESSTRVPFGSIAVLGIMGAALLRRRSPLPVGGTR